MGTDGEYKTSSNTEWQKIQKLTFNDHDLSSVRGALLGGVGRCFTIQIRNPFEDMGKALARGANDVAAPIYRAAYQIAPKTTQKVENWAQQVATGGQMYGEWLSGRGPTERIFGPDSLQSRDLRADGQYRQLADKAKATGEPQIRDFGILGPVGALYHPTQQFVGGYKVVPNVPIGNASATVIYNRTSMKSALFDKGPAYSRGAVSAPGGNTYQYYITEVSRPSE